MRREQIKEFILAWLTVFALLFCVCEGIPRYYRYVVKNTAQLEIEIAKMKIAAGLEP